MQSVDISKFPDQKLRTHTESSVKRREPGILKLSATYNQLCTQLHNLIQTRKAPRNAIAPQRIDTHGLFKLDVDDEIWQDVGLDDDVDGPVPLWLSDDKVRQGIKTLLERDRCVEEEQRLQKERCALQEWTLEEWNCIQRAREVAGNVLFFYYHSIANVSSFRE
jgi:hypothetical protein